VELIWKNAKKELVKVHYNSACLDNIKRLILDFEATHSVKYRTDFEEFLKESNFEDFYDDQERETIYVSTIHKSKGREFDNVYMMLKNSIEKTYAELRTIYVGMTRAKSNLYIHTNTTMFDNYHISGIEHIMDQTLYGEPSEIMLHTTHRDVVLDFFKSKKEIILALRSGDVLKFDDVYLTAERNGRAVRVAKFSKSFMEVLEKLREKGYTAKYCAVRFVVFWKGENDEEETPILLMDLGMEKK
jgi:ATP-dependent DNA helicase RecQ